MTFDEDDTVKLLRIDNYANTNLKKWVGKYGVIHDLLDVNIDYCVVRFANVDTGRNEYFVVNINDLEKE